MNGGSRSFTVLAVICLSCVQCLGQKNDRPDLSGESKPANSTATNATASKNTSRILATATNSTAPLPATVVLSNTSACPASLSSYIEQQQAAHGASNTGDNHASGDKKPVAPQKQTQQSSQPHPGAPPWPPTAVKQGVTCTMEVSHLAAALPGSADVCNVILIRNNLLSVLYSWQLMWDLETKGGLEAVAADGNVLITSTGSGSGSFVRIVNGAQSAKVDAQGGKTSFVLQTTVQNSIVNRAGNTSAASTDPDTSHQVNPAMGSVYLNGLQCTRLPLRSPGTAGQQHADCAATRWTLGTDGLFDAPAASASSNSSAAGGTWSSSNGGSISVPDSVSAALRQLSCTSHYCCGLQVVGPGPVSPPSGSGPPVTAADGLQQDNITGNTSANSSINSSSQIAAKAATAAAAASLTNTSGESNTSEDGGQLQAGKDQQPQQSRRMGDQIIAALVVGLIGAAILAAAIIIFVLRRRKQRQRQEQQRLRLQLLMQNKDPGPVPHLATAALRRGSSNDSTDSNHSQQGVNTSSSGPGTGSLVSLASSPFWQQSGRLPPWLRHYPGIIHTAPASYMSPGAAGGPGAHGNVLRHGSWRASDAAQYTSSGPMTNGLPLARSASSPQPTLHHRQHSADSNILHMLPGPQQSLPPIGPSVATLHHRQGSAHSNITARAVQPQGTAESEIAAAESQSEQATGKAVIVEDTLSRSDSAAASASTLHSAGTLVSSIGTSWGSFKQLFGSGKPPRSSATSFGSSTMAGNVAAGATLSDGSTAAHIHNHMRQGAQQQQLQVLQYQRHHLQLIRETSPLHPSTLPAYSSLVPPLRRQTSEPATAATSSAGTALRGGQQLKVAGDGHSRNVAAAAGLNRHLAGASAISRRISPILSVFEDGSSATSTDSVTPAAWHLTDKQLLEEQPGWLNIDFAQEVRLERKLGEGGFGQVFRARWKDDVIAVKLVPFMSLVTPHSLAASPTAAIDSAHEQSAHASPSGHPAAGAHHSPDYGIISMGMQFSAASLRAIKMEIRVLSQLSHENIVAFKGACLAPPHICILEELAEGGSLHARLYSRSRSKASCRAYAGQAPASQRSSTGSGSVAAGVSNSSRASGAGRTTHQTESSSKEEQVVSGGLTSRSSSSRGQQPPPMSIEEVLRVAVDVATAMQYLHTLKPQVVHRDLKPQNVLLDTRGRAKVCDFGISKMKDASLAASSTRMQAGTPAFMAPEQFEGRPVTDKVDVFAFGVMLWECCEQQQPWKDLAPMQIIYAVGLQKERLGRPASCPDSLWQLIESCWHQQPEMRPTFQEILPRLGQMQADLDLHKSGSSDNQKHQQDDDRPQNHPADPNTTAKVTRSAKESTETAGEGDEQPVPDAQQAGSVAASAADACVTVSC